MEFADQPFIEGGIMSGTTRIDQKGLVVANSGARLLTSAEFQAWFKKAALG